MRFAKSLSIIFLLACIVMTPYAQEQDNVKLPDLTGPYAVGTVSHHLIDESRVEAFTPDDQDDNRELMVQFWYPADAPDGALPGLAWPDDAWIGEARGWSYYANVPDDFWEGWGTSTANAISNAPLTDAGSRFPTLIFTHGGTGSSTLNLYLIEDLASHGYVVVGITHPFNSAAVRFPYGRVVTYNSKSGWIPLHTQDVRFVLDQLEALDQGDVLGEMFADRLDLSRVGVFGVSLGGTLLSVP